MTALTPIMLISSFGFFAISLVIWNYILVLSFYPSAFLIMVKFFMKRSKKKILSAKNQQEEDQSLEQGKPPQALEQKQQDQVQIQNEEQQAPAINEIEKNEEGKILNTNEAKSARQLVELDQQSPTKSKQTNCIDQSPSSASPFNNATASKKSDNEEINQFQQEKEENSKDDNQEKEKYNIIERFFYEKYSPILYKFWYLVIIAFVCWFGVTVYFASQLQAPKEVTQTAPKSNILRKGKDHVLDFHAGKNDNVLKVQMVWGISDIDRDSIDNKWDSNDKGSVVWDESFDLSKEVSQERILNICQDLRANYVGGELVQDDGLDCFMESFKAYAESQGIQFPVPQDQFFNVIQSYTSNNPTGKSYLNNHYIGIIENKVKYLKLTLYGKTYLILQRKEQEPLFEKWENIMKNYNEASPESCNKGFQTAGLGWQWMVTEKKLIDQTIVSLICTGCFALFVLTCSTLNWLISLYSTLSIIGIVIGILALIKLFGWYLGLIESIAAGIVVGFSVEYIVFLCINFLIVDFKTRYLKMQRSLLNMGISILGGAITTLGAGLFLIFGKMDFFPKMGKLLMCTIVFSLLWSLGFFSALCMVAGPMGNTASILYYYNYFKKSCFKPKQ